MAPAAVVDNNPSCIEQDSSDDNEEELIRAVMHKHSVHRGAAARQAATASDSMASRYRQSRAKLWNGNQTGRSNWGSCRNLTWSKNNMDRMRLNAEEPKQQPQQYGTVNKTFKASVPENYVCHICGEKGHYIKDCPHGNEPHRQKKIIPATGCPRKWLRRVSFDTISSINGEVFSLSDGTFAVMKNPGNSCAEFTAQPVESKIHLRYGSSSMAIGDHLRCPLCFNLFHQAVLTPCCGDSFCTTCILDHLKTKNECPSCKAPCDKNELSANTVIDASIVAIRSVGT